MHCTNYVLLNSKTSVYMQHKDIAIYHYCHQNSANMRDTNPDLQVGHIGAWTPIISGSPILGWTGGIKASGVGTSQAVPSCPDGTGLDPNCPSHPDVPLGWDGTAWDVPNHPTSRGLDPNCLSHWDGMGLPGMGLPGMSPTIPPPEALIPTVHPIPIWSGDIPGSPIPSQWDIGMGWTVGIKASGGGMVGDIPGSPIPSQWDIGMGWTVGIKASGGGMVGDIPGSPIPSQWDIGMGWTVGIKASGGGMVGDIPGSPIPSQWDIGLVPGWDGLGHPR